jgi:hypothetical protein
MAQFSVLLQREGVRFMILRQVKTVADGNTEDIIALQH